MTAYCVKFAYENGKVDFIHISAENLARAMAEDPRRNIGDALTEHIENNYHLLDHNRISRIERIEEVARMKRYELFMNNGMELVVDIEQDIRLLAGRWVRVDVIAARADDTPLGPMMIRPDAITAYKEERA